MITNQPYSKISQKQYSSPPSYYSYAMFHEMHSKSQSPQNKQFYQWLWCLRTDVHNLLLINANPRFIFAKLSYQHLR